MKKFVYALILLASMLGTTQAHASSKDYPPPQYVVNKLLLKTEKPVTRFLNVDHYSWYCTTSNRIRYKCYLSGSRNQTLKINNARFLLIVHKGFRHTRVFEDISGVVNLNSSRYATLEPLDW